MNDIPINQIICGDNCEVMRKMPSESIDLVVTSPPYDDLRTYGGHSWDFYGVAWNLKRLLKPGGVIVWVVSDATVNGDETGTSMRQSLHFKDIGLRLHDTMIYERDGCRFPETNRYYPVWEYMFVFSKGKPSVSNLLQDRKNKNYGDKIASSTQREKDGSLRRVSAFKNDREKIVKELGVRFNTWVYSCGNGKSTRDSYAFSHPATFPEALARDHILSWSNEGNIVLDPFSGSGTTAKMAKHSGRRFVGIEINPEYVEISKKRLSQEVFDFLSSGIEE